MSSEKIITYKFGNYFPIRIVIFGYLGILFSIWVGYSLNNPVLGGILMVLPLFVCFTYKGVSVNLSSHQYREYYSYFGIKVGKWQTLEPFKHLAMLSRNFKYNISSFGAQNATIREQVYEVFLLNETHRRRVLLMYGTNLEKMTEKLKNIAEELGVEIVKYSPAVSEKTMMRRQRSR